MGKNKVFSHNGNALIIHWKQPYGRQPREESERINE